MRSTSLILLALPVFLLACDSTEEVDPPAENLIRRTESVTLPLSFVGDRDVQVVQGLFEADYGQITYLTTSSHPEVVSVTFADTATPAFEAVGVGETVITVTATAPSGEDGQISGSYDIEVVVKPECPDAADPALDIFPNDHVPALAFGYRTSYSSSSVSNSRGTLEFTRVTDDCTRGVRDLTLHGTIETRRIVDGEEQGDPYNSTAALHFVVTESDVSVSYSTPASNSPLYVFSNIDRVAPSGETVLVGRVMPGCEGPGPYFSRVWFTPGTGFDRMAGGCRVRGPEQSYTTWTFSMDRI